MERRNKEKGTNGKKPKAKKSPNKPRRKRGLKKKETFLAVGSFSGFLNLSS